MSLVQECVTVIYSQLAVKSKKYSSEGNFEKEKLRKLDLICKRLIF